MTETTETTETTNPFAQFLPHNFVSQWTEQGTERFEALVEQWETWQKRGAEQAEKAVEESASLAKSTLDYSLSLQSEFRKQAVENAKKTLEMFGGAREGEE